MIDEVILVVRCRSTSLSKLGSREWRAQSCEAGWRMSLWLKQQSMGDEKDAFYVVRKGNVIGIYKSLSDLQALIRSSQPGSSKDKPLSKDFQEKRAQEMAGSPLYSTAAQQKPGKLDNFLEVPPISSYCVSFFLEILILCFSFYYISSEIP
nr:uncharacterized protein LOC109178191 [Ipomoea trifida]GMD54816.1 Hop-interacting protein THI034 [Ipomoea batatas]